MFFGGGVVWEGGVVSGWVVGSLVVGGGVVTAGAVVGGAVVAGDTGTTFGVMTLQSCVSGLYSSVVFVRAPLWSLLQRSISLIG